MPPNPVVNQKDRLFQYFRRFTDVETCRQMLDDLQAHLQKDGLCCPHCQSRQVVGHGKYKDRRRYKCKQCARTFNDFTNTPLNGTHYPHKWIKFLECMIHSLSLRRSAIRVGVTWVTLFHWRHKIINLLKTISEPEPFQGSAPKNQPSAISKQTAPASFHPPKLLSFQEFFSQFPELASVPIVNDYFSFPPHFAHRKSKCTTSTTYIMVKYRKTFPGIPFREQQEFGKWIRSFDRIANKYWTRYIAWFRFLKKGPYMSDVDSIRNMLLTAGGLRMHQTQATLFVGS